MERLKAEVNIPGNTIHVNIHPFAHEYPEREETSLQMTQAAEISGVFRVYHQPARFFFACKAG